jgi:DNA-binding response OmpR family regulator
VRDGAADERQRVVVVEDDADIAAMLMDVLAAEGFAPATVSDAADLEGELAQRPDLIVLDLRLTRGGAESIMRSLNARGMSDVPILLLSAASDLPDRARELGVTSFLAKPFELDAFVVLVRRLL